MVLSKLLAALALAANSDTTRFAVLNHGRPAGELLVLTAGDTVMVKYHHIDRQRGPRSETRYIVRKGSIVSGETWPLPLYGPELVPRPPASDRFEVVRDSVFWRVRDTLRGARLTPNAFYRLRSNTPYDVALVARFLLSRPDRTAQLLPGGATARLEIVTDTIIRAGGKRLRVRLAMIHARGNPVGVWLDDRNELFAGEVSGWFATIRPGSEDAIPALRSMEFAYRNRRGAELARRLAPPAASAIAIVNGDLFDSERGAVLPRHTVVIRGDRIVAVGPSDSVSVPANATIIDAAGKTVMPGMIDMHTHAFLSSQSTSSLAHLALGLTTIRDVAADLDIATQLRDRAAKGEILSPRVVLAGFIEGPGKWAGPSEAIATTEAEARAWVARYDSAGYKQIKLYNLVQQDLVPVIAEETRKRGMRLSGHVPRGLSTPTAVRLGFDEINHAAFLFSTFYPESLYIPVMRAYSAVSQIVAPSVNVDGADVTSMIQLFKERGTVIDGTWNLWLAQRAGNPGLGIPGTPDTLAQKLDRAYMRMLKRLFDAGVTLVPGTDGSSYNVELELYEKSGIPAPEVLRIATIIPAKVMKDDADYGSIKVGKVADIIVVDGRPSERVSDLRKVERVIRAGKPYEVKALQAALQQ